MEPVARGTFSGSPVSSLQQIDQTEHKSSTSKRLVVSYRALLEQFEITAGRGKPWRAYAAPASLRQQQAHERSPLSEARKRKSGHLQN
jgi:hypothetical protein